LLEAIRDLPNIRLDIVGSGELRANIAGYIKKNNLSDRVKIHENTRKQDLASLTQSADILCLPSIERTEAFGLAIIEAAALSKPALVSNLQGSGMSWVVRHGETGWIFEEASSSDLAKMIMYLLKNKHLLRKAGVEARRRFLEEFLIAKIEAEVLRTYH
jgi:rhamnosyl/mannosyltransferase